jgi:hypothetical protein
VEPGRAPRRLHRLRLRKIHGAMSGFAHRAGAAVKIPRRECAARKQFAERHFVSGTTRGAAVISGAMKTSIIRLFAACVISLTTAGAARAQASLVGEELGVIQAMATILNQEADAPYDFLYFESDFSTSPYVASSMENPDRTQFCGLSREEGMALVSTLTQLNQDPLEFDKTTARPAGLRIGHKKLPRFRYLMLSRVVFGPGNRYAFIAVDLNGSTGAVMRLDKVNGAWSKTARCGGWIKTA